MDDELERLNDKINKVDYFSYKIKNNVAFITSACHSAMITDDGVDIVNDLIVTVFFENQDMFEFAFDDFETKGDYIKFYKDNAVLTLGIK